MIYYFLSFFYLKILNDEVKLYMLRFLIVDDVCSGISWVIKFYKKRIG